MYSFLALLSSFDIHKDFGYIHPLPHLQLSHAKRTFMQRKTIIILAIIGGFLLLCLAVFGWATGMYNSLIKVDESMNQAWAEVENQYQRRSDLIPNLVEVVKGYAKHEKETLTQVVEARAKATQTTINAGQLSDAGAFQKFQAAQDQLGSALSRLMVVVEKYPELKANE